MEKDKKPLGAIQDFTAVGKKRLYEDIVEQIRAQILSGRLRLGDKLPPERELVKIFQVSRNTLREAIKSLEQRLVLKSVPGSGTFVASGDDQAIVNFLASSLLKETSKLLEIFQVRRIFEPQVAALAAKNASPRDIQKLELLIEKQEVVSNSLSFDSHSLIMLDNDFHLALAQASGNEIIGRIVEKINVILSDCREEAYQSELRTKMSIAGHTKIVIALKKKDAKLAEKVTDDHLKLVEKIVLDHILAESKERIH